MGRRLLLIVKNFPPYRTEPNTANLVKYLGRQGWKIDVLCSRPGWGGDTGALTRTGGRQLLRQVPRRRDRLERLALVLHVALDRLTPLRHQV